MKVDNLHINKLTMQKSTAEKGGKITVYNKQLNIEE